MFGNIDGRNPARSRAGSEPSEHATERAIHLLTHAAHGGKRIAEELRWGGKEERLHFASALEFFLSCSSDIYISHGFHLHRCRRQKSTIGLRIFPTTQNCLRPARQRPEATPRTQIPLRTAEV